MVSAKEGIFIKPQAKGSRVIIVVVHVGAMKIYVAAVEALRKKERGDEIQFTIKIGGKLVWIQLFIPSYVFDALLCPNWQFSPPNRLTLWLTLVC